MASRFQPEKVRDDAAQIVKVWEGTTDFKMKDVTIEAFKAAHADLAATLEQIAEMEEKLGVLRNHRDDQTVKLNDLCTRARSGVRAFFGPDSSEYELVGGTRTSERKKPQRKPADAPTK